MTARQITDQIVEDKGTYEPASQLKGRVVRALKRQEKALESRMGGKERVWKIRQRVL